MESFKTYYQINEFIGSALKAAGDKIDKGISTIGQAPGKAFDAATSGAGNLVVPDISNITTFEDLNKIIKGIVTRAKAGEIVDKAIGVAVDQTLGLFPGASNLKSAFDVLKSFGKQPDDKKTGSFIDKLDVDDKLSMIVDDTIEGKFLKHIQKDIEGRTGTIPPDWDINMALKQYLSDEFKGRTVAGQKGVKPVADPHLGDIE